MSNGPARRPRGVIRRREILDAAIDEFSERGPDGASIEAIAESVGCIKSLIYYYFGNKEGLRDAVLGEMVEANLLAWAESQDLPFAEWVQLTTGYLARHPDDRWVRLAVLEGLADTGHALLEDERARSLGQSTTTVIRAQSSGEVDPDLDPDLVSLLVLFLSIGPTITPQLVRMLTGLSPHDASFQNRNAEFIDQIVRRLAPLPR